MAYPPPTAEKTYFEEWYRITGDKAWEIYNL
jgi:hypothetical protein